MKSLLTLTSILLLAGVLRAQDVPGQNVVKTYVLDNMNVYVIHVPPPNGGVTTISFPAGITALEGDNVSTSPNPNARFLIDYQSGNNFFSLISTGKGETNLNVIYRKQTYVLDLVTSPPERKPDFAVNFVLNTLTNVSGGGPLRMTHAAPLPTPVLIGLLDKAKALPVIAQSNPDIWSQVAVSDPHRVMYYNGFRVQIDKVYRFEQEDTVVFELTMINDSTAEVDYLPNNFAVRVGNRVFTQSISEASGIIPAGHGLLDAKGAPQLDENKKPIVQSSMTNAYFAITGDDMGNRNNLSVENPWNVMVSRVNDNNLRQIDNSPLTDDVLPQPGAMAAQDPKGIK